MGAARGIDQVSPLWQLCEQAAVQNAACLRRQRQQADQNVAAGEERAKGRFTGKALDARHVFFRAAPSRHGKTKVAQPLTRHDADFTEAQYADAGFRRAFFRHRLRPFVFGLRGQRCAKPAVMDQRVQHAILRHLQRQRRIDEAHQRHMLGKGGVAQEAVHTGAQREDRLQLRQAAQQPGIRPEAQRIVDVTRRVSVLAVHDQVEIGKAMGRCRFAKRRQPDRRPAHRKDQEQCGHVEHRLHIFHGNGKHAVVSPVDRSCVS